MKYLSASVRLSQWQYSQSADDPCSLQEVLALLHDYLEDKPPVHLVGHGIAGTVGWLYTCQYPERVQTLSLLGVNGNNIAYDWQAHYYARRRQQGCERRFVLAQVVRDLFGEQSISRAAYLAKLLERDLRHSPSPHSLLQECHVSAAGCAVPLSICNSRDDRAIAQGSFHRWKAWLKMSDRLWECPGGGHFFHHFYPHWVEERLLSFWDEATCPSLATLARATAAKRAAS